MNRREAGFTLIELIVVVAIVGIMAVIAVPSFAMFISNYRATSVVNDFLQGVTITRAEALKRGRKVLMIPNGSDGTPNINGDWIYGWTVFVDNNNNQIYQAATDELIFQHGALPTTVTTVGANGGIAFADGSGKIYVQIDGSGYPRLLSGTPASGGIVMTDNTGSRQTRRTMCLGNVGRPRVVSTGNGLDPSGCVNG